ncbi:MAG: VCBS repeat-containing protein [Acidobacteriota bacterium]|nr:VCBS repeat-containing protein [Acidobacteriota bacterium]
MKNIINHSIFCSGLVILLFIGQTFAAPRAVYFDYFGTGRSSYLDFTTSQNTDLVRWDLLRTPVTQSPQTRRVFWGRTRDDRVFGDFDGDLKYDIAVYRRGSGQNSPGYFYVQRSSDNSMLVQPWGKGFDRPAEGDFDGDGKNDFAVIRYEEASAGGFNLVWYIFPSGGGAHRRIVWGIDSQDVFDIPIFPSGDFNNDGRDDLVVARIDFDANKITYYVGDAQTGAIVLAQPWGDLEIPAFLFVGNFVGDSRADVGVFYTDCPDDPGCALGATWWIKETGNDNHRVVKFGIPFNIFTEEGDLPDFGDYDGDGKFDISVFRRAASTYFHQLSSNNQVVAQFWSGLIPLPGTVADGLLDGAFEPQEKQQSVSPSLGASRATFVMRNADGTVTAKRGGAEILRPKK